MILIHKVEKKLSEKFKKELLLEIGPQRIVQVLPELMIKHETQVPGQSRDVGPAGNVLLMNDTFYGTIDYNEKGEIDGINITDKDANASAHLVHFCTNVKKDNSGQVIEVFPEYLPGVCIISPTDVEKYFFYSRACRGIKSSLNATSNKQKSYRLTIADPAGDATKELANEKYESKVKYLLSYDESEGGWDFETIKSIARQLFLVPENYPTQDLLKKAILVTAENDERRRTLSGDPTVFGYNFVLHAANKKGNDHAMREIVALAVNSRHIKHDMQRQSWVMVNPGDTEADDTVIANICPCENTAAIKENILMSFLKHNPEVLEKIESMTNPKKEKVEKPKKTAETKE